MIWTAAEAIGPIHTQLCQHAEGITGTRLCELLHDRIPADVVYFTLGQMIASHDAHVVGGYDRAVYVGNQVFKPGPV